ncbi:MAG TPA: thioredoxin-dependent thiol peroxidase [Blastocatellia bacterium]|nr:thioredoxin-dependent thiol peroxidase [Blastocatellia bacterium]
MKLLEVGDKAPNFKTTDQNGKPVSLADYKGQKVILYFYPKDDTPGCTKEACGFRDAYAAFKKLKAAILGVSTDDEKSHKKFVEKYSLPFTLLADTDKKIVNGYGVWGEKSLYGKKYMGTNRVTYLIDESGQIAAVFPKVKPEEHADELLVLLKKK